LLDRVMYIKYTKEQDRIAVSAHGQLSNISQNSYYFDRFLDRFKHRSALERFFQSCPIFRYVSAAALAISHITVSTDLTSGALSVLYYNEQDTQL
jgi:hypothetical protein